MAGCCHPPDSSLLLYSLLSTDLMVLLTWTSWLENTL